MTTVRQLVTVWGFDVDDKPLRDLEKQQKLLMGSLGKLAALGVGAAASLFGIAKWSANAGDAAAKTSQALGVNIEALQEMQYAAGLAGVETESFNTSLRILSKSMFEVTRGTKTNIDAFAKVGKELPALIKSGAPTEKILAAVSDRFKEMPDGVTKTALALELFEKSGAQMIPLLNQGSDNLEKMAAEARALGLVIDGETAKASEEFNDNLRRMWKFLDGLKNLIGGPLIKALNPMIRSMFDFLVLNQELIKGELQKVFEGVASTAKTVFEVFSRLFKITFGIIKAFGGLGRITKVVGVGMALIFGATSILAMGKVVIALKAVAMGFKFLGIAALKAQMKMLAIPLAIGAAIAAIALLVEDVYGFLHGKDSLIGRFFEAFPKVGAAIGNIFGPIFRPIVGIIDELISATTSWKNVFVLIGKVIMGAIMAPVQAVWEIIKGIGQIPFIRKGMEAMFGTKDKPLSFDDIGNSPVMNNVLNTTPERIGGQGAAISNDVKIEVNTANLPPNEAAAAVQSGVSDGLERALRPTHQALSSGVAY